jgi:hypothetical protein
MEYLKKYYRKLFLKNKPEHVSNFLFTQKVPKKKHDYIPKTFFKCND